LRVLGSEIDNDYAIFHRLLIEGRDWRYKVKGRTSDV
jgi:hypothetical protein